MHGMARNFPRPGRSIQAVSREITFADSDKIDALIARTPTRMVLEDRQAFEHGIRRGLGSVNLMLTKDQYLKLLRYTYRK